MHIQSPGHKRHGWFVIESDWEDTKQNVQFLSKSVVQPLSDLCNEIERVLDDTLGVARTEVEAIDES